jgi:XcyI restriction endonuclease
MARSPDKVPAIRCPSISRQIAFQQLLAAARKTWLHEALSEALSVADPAKVKAQLTSYVPEDAQRLLAAARVRDEHVFPVPIVLETKPTLIGYYRLLAGIPQKSFYAANTGMAPFKSMEASGVLNEKHRQLLPAYCREMCRALGEIVRQISPAIKQVSRCQQCSHRTTGNEGRVSRHWQTYATCGTEKDKHKAHLEKLIGQYSYRFAGP